MPYNCGLKLGSWNLPDPTAETGWNRSPVIRAVDTVMADTSVATDTFANELKYRYEIRWRMLTSDEFANVTGAWSQFLLTGNELAFEGMDLLTPTTVTRDPGNYEVQSESSWVGGGYRYDASITLREV